MSWKMMAVLALWAATISVMPGVSPWMPDLLVIFAMAAVLRDGKRASWTGIAAAGLLVGAFSAQPWTVRAGAAVFAALLAGGLRPVTGVRNRTNLALLCILTCVGVVLFETGWRLMLTAWSTTPEAVGALVLRTLITILAAPLVLRRLDAPRRLAVR